MQAKCKLIFYILVNPLLLVKCLKVISVESIKAVFHIKNGLCLLLKRRLYWNGHLWDWLSKVLLRWEMRVHITWREWVPCYILLLRPLVLEGLRWLGTLIGDVSRLPKLRWLTPIVCRVEILLLCLRIHLPDRILVGRLLPWLILLLTPLIIL